MKMMADQSGRARRFAQLQLATIVLSVCVVAVASIATANAIQLQKLQAGFKPLARAVQAPVMTAAALDESTSQDD